jgi:hypothetical protein
MPVDSGYSSKPQSMHSAKPLTREDNHSKKNPEESKQPRDKKKTSSRDFGSDASSEQKTEEPAQPKREKPIPNFPRVVVSPTTSPTQGPSSQPAKNQEVTSRTRNADIQAHESKTKPSDPKSPSTGMTNTLKNRDRAV